MSEEVKKQEPKPEHNGIYQCVLEMYGDQANTTVAPRFYSDRCGWLTGKDEIVIEFKNKVK